MFNVMVKGVPEIERSVSVPLGRLAPVSPETRPQNRRRINLNISGAERNFPHIDSYLSSGPVEKVRVGRDCNRSIEHYGGSNGLRSKEVQLTR